MLRHGNFIHKTGAQTLNRSSRSQVIRITSNNHRLVNGTDKRRNRPAGFQRITMTAILLANLETNMSCANAHMLRITHSEINVTDIRPIKKKDPKMISWNKIP